MRLLRGHRRNRLLNTSWQSLAPLAETLSTRFLPKGLLVGGNFEDSSQGRASEASGSDIAGD